MKEDEVAALQAVDRAAAERIKTGSHGIGGGKFDVKSLLAWAAVGIPLAWGIWITLDKALILFE